MKPNHKAWAWIGVLVAAGLAYASWLGWRAHRNLVTLNVRDMEVRKVVSKIERQTWETIVVHSNVQGKVTMNVQSVPLEEVLKIIGDQTGSSWSMLYPLYSSSRSLTALKKSMRGELEAWGNGWTNYQGGGMFRGGGPMFGGGGPMGGAANNPSASVSLQIQNKDVSFVTMAFSRFAGTRVVAEDGTAANITLMLDKVPVAKAVARLAKQAHRSWTRLYSLRGGFGMMGGRGGGPGGGGPPQQFGMMGGTNAFGSRGPDGSATFAPQGTNTTNQPGPGGPGPMMMTAEQREQFQKQREALEAQLMQALPTEERQKAEREQQTRQQQFQDMQNLTPEQRRERFGQMGGAAMDQRNRDRLRNTTPEQRAEQSRAMSQMRQRFQQQQQQQQQAPPSR